MREAWVTGIGLVTALGPDRETTWRRLVAGESGLGPLTLFDASAYRTHNAGEVDLARVRRPPEAAAPWRRCSRATRFALAAASEALADAALAPGRSELPWAVVFGGGTAGLFEAESFLERRLRVGPKTKALSEFVEVPQDAPSDRVAEVYRVAGPRVTVTTACSSSTIAVGLAAEMVRDGEVEVALAGGPDALTRLTYAGFNSLRAVDPDGARPFDRRRRGLSVGEGAAVLVVESSERAAARGREPYAVIRGYGLTNDAFHMTQPEPSGAAWERTLRAALADAGATSEAVDYVNAHGTATEQNDAAECAAYRRIFGDRLPSIPISSVKGALGHCLCGAGGIEAAITALAVARGTVPPTARFAEPDPDCPIDPVPVSARSVAVGLALSSSFAFGGNSAVLVLGRPA